MPLQTRGDGVSIPTSNQVVISTSVDVLDDLGFNIGFIQQLTRNDSRPTTPVRHLDSIDAGRILEQAPGVEDDTLNFTGLALYNTGVDNRSLLNRLPGSAGSGFKSLNSNSIPFEVTEAWTHPTTGLTGSTLFGDVLLTTYSRPVNIGTATISETAAGRVTFIE
jgi:hypothetical protein